MKSKLVLRVHDHLSPFSNTVFTGDWLGINVLDGAGNTILLHETKSINRSVKGLYLQGRGTVAGLVNEVLVPKFTADWGNTGGYQNVKFWYTGDDNSLRELNVELQNELWTFGSIVGGAIDNGKVTVTSKDNAPPPTPKTVTLTQTNTVDCGNKTIQYTVDITGGVAPYTIKGTAYGNVQATGGSQAIQLFRGIPTNVTVTDSQNVQIGTQSLTAPIALASSHFTISVSQEELSAQALITPNVTLPPAVFPIQYSLDDTNYQASGGFSGLEFEQLYTIYIKDSFDCVTTKVFVTPPSVAGSEEPEIYARYFQISNAGTLLFSKYEDFTPTTKKNFTNTSSRNEHRGLPYSYVQEFDESDLIVQQFKSSYDWHRILMITENDSFDITPVLQSQNLRLFEKVDAKLFRNENGALGVYFRNGNTYIENTTTPNGSSDYNEVNHPSWARAGNKIKIDGIGTIKIKRISRDSVRGIYLEMVFPYSSLTDDDAMVQANYNRQPYNTYEFGFFMESVPTYGSLIIEAGFNGLAEVTYKSECIQRINDTCDRMLIQWKDPLNISGIVHQTGISHYARLHASFYNLTKSESKTHRGDNDAFKIDQEAYRIGVLNLVVKGHGMENKMHLAAGMETFFINGINYREVSFTSEIKGSTNLYEIEGEFETGGNNLSINPDELVLKEPLTGITNKPQIPDPIPSMLAIGNGGFVANGFGGGIIINE